MTFCYESIKPGYYDEIFHKRLGIQSFWHRLKFAGIQRCLPQGIESVLDVGCGPGTFLGNFLPKAVKGIGIDIAQPQIDYACAKYQQSHIDFMCTADILPFDHDHFDVVTCIELIEHLKPKEVSHLLHEIRRVLKPGGTFILTTPNYAGFWPIVEWFVNHLSPISYKEQHITKFRKKTLAKLLQQHGFKTKVSRYMGFAPFTACFSPEFCLGFANLERHMEAAYGMLLLATGCKI